jgi:hypothetical protein
MATTLAFAGEGVTSAEQKLALKTKIHESLARLVNWLEVHDYRGYDTFDGLSSRIARPLTFETKLLRTVLQQGVRRFPLNLRPLLGIAPARSTKGMAFVARGYIRLHQATGEQVWADRAKEALAWLVAHQSTGYSGACWGNHFDYQSRTFYLPRGVPTVVWTSLIGHAFLDAYEHFGTRSYLDVAASACEHLRRDLQIIPDGRGSCISYIPGQDSQVHNANTLGGSLLARTAMHTGDLASRELAAQSLQYTAQYQRPDASWWYGEKENLHWVDNFHTAYVLDCFLHFENATGDLRFHTNMMTGYTYWKDTFFLPDGTPRYYSHKTLPVDIQCCSQAIDTLVFFSGQDPSSLALAERVALWTIDHMQDRTGYFYYRRYSPWLVNTTPTLHWGQATMLCALSNLYKSLLERDSPL